MKRLELYNKAASDEVLREWLCTMYKESDSYVTFAYETKENVAKTPSSFNGSVGALVDGRLIKIEYQGIKGVDELASITVERRHVSRGSEPTDVALLSSERVIDGMLAGDFGDDSVVEVANIDEVVPYEDYSGKRVSLRFAVENVILGDVLAVYLCSMSELAYKAAALEPGARILIVKTVRENPPNYQILGFAELTAELELAMLNNWQKPTAD